jgi:hypothetical protein
MIWVWIIAAVILVVVIALSSSIKCRLTIIREEQNDEIVCDVHGLYGLVKRRLVIPIIKFKNLVEGVEVKADFIDKKEQQLVSVKEDKITSRSIKESFDNMLTLLKNCFGFHKWLVDTLSHVRCTRLEWTTHVGVGDAPETALVTGMIWGLKSTMLGFVFRFIKLEARPAIHVVPRYNKAEFSTNVLVILQIRFIYVTAAGFHLLYRIIKIKGGLRAWQRVLFKA